MKSKIRYFLITCGAIFFLLSFVAEGFSVPPKHRLPKPHPGNPYFHKVRPKHRPPIYKKRRYIVAPPAFRPKPPGPKYIWVPRYKHPSGIYIGGYWRPPSKPSFIWVDGYWNEEGEWVFGYWKPIEVKPGYLWAPGYWDNTIWVEGYWRPAKKPNYIWVPGYYNTRGVRIKGHWK